MSFRINRRQLPGTIGALGAALTMPAIARAGGTVKVGMTSALSGPARALGLGMQAGIQAHFDAVNASGGVHGRQLELVVMDDGYEPARAAKNMRSLIDEMGVFAILGNAGTPTAAVTVPIANEKKVPLFGAFTGAGLLRKMPPDRYILNYRASYAQETEEMVRGAVEDLGLEPSNIAFFTQNDAYGDSGYIGGMKALKTMGFDGAKLPHGRYSRNTINVEDGLSRLLDPREKVRAVIMVGAYAPCAQFILLGRQHGLKALFMNVSFVGSQALAGALGEKGEGVVVTQAVPHPDLDIPSASLFREEVASSARSFVSFEGHLVARSFVSGLQEAGPNADSEAWIEAMETGHDLGLELGVEKRLSKRRHQISDTVWPTMLRDGSFQAMSGWMDVRGQL